jgi:hypothetical protein
MADTNISKKHKAYILRAQKWSSYVPPNSDISIYLQVHSVTTQKTSSGKVFVFYGFNTL